MLIGPLSTSGRTSGSKTGQLACEERASRRHSIDHIRVWSKKKVKNNPGGPRVTRHEPGNDPTFKEVSSRARRSLCPVPCAPSATLQHRSAPIPGLFYRVVEDAAELLFLGIAAWTWSCSDARVEGHFSRASAGAHLGSRTDAAAERVFEITRAYFGNGTAVFARCVVPVSP